MSSSSLMSSSSARTSSGLFFCDGIAGGFGNLPKPSLWKEPLAFYELSDLALSSSSRLDETECRSNISLRYWISISAVGVALLELFSLSSGAS